jgi:CheY-like chemotaxis protein
MDCKLIRRDVTAPERAKPYSGCVSYKSVEYRLMCDMQMPRSAAELVVLIAEDNTLNQKIIVRMVRSLGCSVDAVATGLEAIDAVLRRRYDVVLMDIRMPDMNGLDATRSIRRQLPADQQPHIYALTAGIGPDERQACYDVGMNGFVAKPVVMDQLALLFSELAN